MRFVPIGLEEYQWIEAQVEDGTYEHPEVGYQKFSVRAYRTWLAEIEGRKQVAG